MSFWMRRDQLTRVSLVIFSCVMAFAVTACFYLSLSQLAGTGIVVPGRGPLAILLACGVIALAHRSREKILNGFAAVTHIPNLFLYAILVGLFLRLVVWAVFLPAVQISDGASYFELASRLVSGQEYKLDGFAFWPPGTPFIYSAFMWSFGPTTWLPLLVNLCFFLMSALAVRTICRLLSWPPAYAGVVVALLAIWPELFLTAGQVSKETLLIGLLPCAFALILSASVWKNLAAGLFAGLIVLTQPSLMLLPILFGAALLSTRPWKVTLIRLSLMVAGMLIVVSPWTYRNYQVFGELVPVSTNSGLVLHAGNQPAMLKSVEQVGGFITPPAPAEPLKDDLALSRWHTEQAKQFIETHPRDFFALVLNRVILTIGDDSDSAYRSLRLTNKVSGKTYFLTKALCNAYWILLTALLWVFCWCYQKHEHASAIRPVVWLTCIASLYLMAMHGIAEGGARHHMAWSWVYALLLAGVLSATNSAASKDR